MIKLKCKEYKLKKANQLNMKQNSNEDHKSNQESNEEKLEHMNTDKGFSKKELKMISQIISEDYEALKALKNL